MEQLPSKFQIGNKAKIQFVQTQEPFNCSILGVHFYANKIKYDVEIGIADEPPTRIYNVDELFVN